MTSSHHLFSLLNLVGATLAVAATISEALHFHECTLSSSSSFEIVPEHYDLTLKMCTITSSTSGFVDINLRLPDPDAPGETTASGPGELSKELSITKTKLDGKRKKRDKIYRILLHGDSSLKIQHFKYYDLGKPNKPAKRTLKGVSICQDPSTRMIELRFNHSLKPGTFGRLHIEFKGKLNPGKKGNKWGQMWYSLAKDACLLFPSFDSDRLRSTFSIKLLHEYDILSVSSESKAIGNDSFGGVKLVQVNQLGSKLSPMQMAFKLHNMKFVSMPPEDLIKGK